MQTRPALKALCLFTTGVLLGRFFNTPVLLVLAIAVLAFFGSFTLWYAEKGKRRLLELLLLIGMIAVGCLRYQLSVGYFPTNHISNFTNQLVEMSGVIVKYPEQRINKINLTIETEKLYSWPDTILTEGKVLVSVFESGESFEYGDEIQIYGMLRKPRARRNPGEFDYREYLLSQQIFGTISVYDSSQVTKLSSGNGSWAIRKVVFPAKHYFDKFIADKLPSEESALLHGLLIGERGEITPELRESFSKLGVIHILAVSGLHVGFIILIFMGILGFLRIPFEAQVCLTILGLIFYAYLTNLKPPVVRASMMGGLFLFGILLQRKTDLFNILPLAALILLIINPLELFQAGFQLSFTAVTAIAYLYPKLKEIDPLQKMAPKLYRFIFIRYPWELLLVSTAAFLGTLPLTITYFYRLPLFSIIANIFIIPLAFCGLTSGFIAALFNLLLPVVADLYVASSWFFLHTLLKLVEWGSQFTFSQLEIYSFSFFQMVIYFVGVILLANISRRRFQKWSIIYLILVANILIWDSNTANKNELKAVFLDVGQGDAALLKLPDGKHLLIDGGPASMDYSAGKWIVGPYLKRQQIDEIDALILSHADADHLGGFPYILRNFKVHEVWDNGDAAETELYQEYLALIDSLKIERRILKAGNSIRDFEPVEIFVLHPSDAFLNSDEPSKNDASLTLKISYGEIDFLFLGDLEESGEFQVTQFGELLDSEVLKVSHHGSNTSSSQSLLDYVRPDFAVISAGEFNKFGHPQPEVLARLYSTTKNVLRTDQSGAIILSTDGKKINQINWK